MRHSVHLKELKIERERIKEAFASSCDYYYERNPWEHEGRTCLILDEKEGTYDLADEDLGLMGAGTQADGEKSQAKGFGACGLTPGNHR